MDYYFFAVFLTALKWAALGRLDGTGSNRQSGLRRKTQNRGKRRKKKKKEKEDKKKGSGGFFWGNQGKRGGRRYQLKLGGRNVLKSVSGMSPWCLPHAFFLTVTGFNHL